MTKTILSWSGGKDSALALHELKASGDEVSALLTTYNSDYGRVFMHGVRIELIRRQATALGLPLIEVGLSKEHTADDYDKTMEGILLLEKENGTSCVAFGDIFLEDLRMQREERLRGIGFDALFPLWKKETKALAERFINLGYKAVVTCVDGYELDENFAGREYDREFLEDLPPEVDPCGENGEFHTFTYDGPAFGGAIRFRRGMPETRDGRFRFFDLIPND